MDSIASTDQTEQLRSLLRAAGECLLGFWPGGEGGSALRSEQKADGSLVSQADLAANALLTSELRRLFPDDGIHSEEAAYDAAQWKASRVWIIDPLDGTDVFLRGRDEFSVLVALTVEGRPVLAFMYFPARKLLLEAEAGRGASINGKPLSVSAHAQPRRLGVYARNCTLGNRELLYPERLDSGLSFLMLVQGELDAVAFRLSKLKEWDLAAPSLIVEEAGGKVSDGEGKAVSFRAGELPPSYIASNSACHEYVRSSCKWSE